MEPGKTNNETDFLSPLLIKLRDKKAFIVPEDYFIKVEEKLLSSTIKKDTSASTALLKQKNNPFKIPGESAENYFDNLSGRIFQKIKNEKSSKIISIRRFNSGIFYWAAAASIAIILTIYYYQGTVSSNAEMLVSAEEVLNSVYLHQIDETSITDEFSSAEIISEEKNIEDYLINNEIDETSLILEL